MRYTKEEEEFLRNNALKLEDDELVKEFNKKFKAKRTKVAIRKKRYMLGYIYPREKSYFKKGRTPHNKGRKMEEYASPEVIERIRKTQFKKGDKPVFTRKEGDERHHDNGLVEVKVENERWVAKHRLIYERANSVKLTNENIVIFLDGDKTNLEIDNLKLVTREEHVFINRWSKYHNDKELNEAEIMITKIRRKISSKVDRNGKVRK